MNKTNDSKREMLRHAVATLAYRCGKSLRDAPENFAEFHIGEKKWNNPAPLPWQQEVERFFNALQKLDDYLASNAPLGNPVEKLFQGPLADALTHTGQLAMLRRLAGRHVRGENYFKAEIHIGRVGPEQSTKRAEFD